MLDKKEKKNNKYKATVFRAAPNSLGGVERGTKPGSWWIFHIIQI
jgi:hypothetical protein